MQYQGQNINIVQPIHCKKRLSIFPSQPGCHLPNNPWPGIIKLFPVRESSVSEIPAGDRKIIFLQCTHASHYHPLYCFCWLPFNSIRVITYQRADTDQVLIRPLAFFYAIFPCNIIFQQYIQGKLKIHLCRPISHQNLKSF